jgi:hypothetical protein
MAAHFRHLRAQYYDDDPAGARGLRHYHVREQEMAGLLGTETRHPPLFRIPRHAHDLPSFYVVLEGDLTEYSERRESRLPTSSVVFTPPGEIHSNAFHGSGGRCFLVEFTSRWTDQLGASGAMLHRPLAAAAGELAPLAVRVYQEFRDPDRISPLAVEGLTLEILAAFARQWEDRPDLRAPGWLRNARDLVHDRFTETMTAGTIAGAVGVHPVRLPQTFPLLARRIPAPAAGGTCLAPAGGDRAHAGRHRPLRRVRRPGSLFPGVQATYRTYARTIPEQVRRPLIPSKTVVSVQDRRSGRVHTGRGRYLARGVLA